MGALGICGWGPQLCLEACKIAQSAPVHPPRTVSKSPSRGPVFICRRNHDYWAPTCPSPRSTYAWHWKKLTRSWGKKTESQRHHLSHFHLGIRRVFLLKGGPTGASPGFPRFQSPPLNQLQTLSIYLPHLPHLDLPSIPGTPEPRALTPGQPLGVLLESSCSTSLPSLHSFYPPALPGTLFFLHQTPTSGFLLVSGSCPPSCPIGLPPETLPLPSTF